MKKKNEKSSKENSKAETKVGPKLKGQDFDNPPTSITKSRSLEPLAKKDSSIPSNSKIKPKTLKKAKKVKPEEKVEDVEASQAENNPEPEPVEEEVPTVMPRRRLSSEKAPPKPKLNVKKVSRSVSREKKVKDDFDDMFDAPTPIKTKGKKNKKAALMNSITDAANLRNGDTGKFGFSWS
jgi:hypothetical protein